jgi:hypothetical protein
MRFLLRLGVYLLIAWLPVQGFAAAAMPFCKHMHDGSGSHQSMPAVHEHHHNGGGGDLEHHTALAGLACDDCFACHLACGSLMTTGHFFIAEISAQHALHARAASAAYYFYPEQPSRPPLTVFA